jgi:hypothetical protein
MGVPIGSDWQDKPEGDPVFDLYRTCGFWSKAESRMLLTVAEQFGGDWIEIGAHSGWCTTVLTVANDMRGRIVAIEPMFSRPDWYSRFAENTGLAMAGGLVMPWAGRSDQYFAVWDGGGGRTFDGALIDGDHVAPCPLNDARNVFDRLNERAVVLLHDFRGPAVWDAAKYLVDRGMNFKVYPSVHMVCVCWRGEFNAPLLFQEGTTDWETHYGLPEWAR